MTRPRIVITGMGAITPIGLCVQDYWQNLLSGISGVGTISRFDASDLPVQIAAEIRDFDNKTNLPRSLALHGARFAQYAYLAALEALAQAKLDVMRTADRLGLTMGTAMAGIAESDSPRTKHAKNGKVSPHFVPQILGNMPSAHLAISLGIHGPGLTLNTACSSGADAVMSAALLLLAGQADAVLAMGGESILCPSVLSSLAQAKALSRRNAEPSDASRPFDLERDGFVIGEGGGAILLETEAHAKKRGADILALLRGWANNLDAHHITAPDPCGSMAAKCMKSALECAGLSATDIDYINAHGTSTPLGDRAETNALKAVFGNNNSAPPISSTKGATGHLMGAGGITELIACVLAIGKSLLPPTINLNNPDPACDLDFIPNHPRRAKVRSAMSNSLGFGGQNSSIIVSRYSEE